MSDAQSMPTRGLIMDGAIGSEQVDSSGEVLDVAGCDISSLPKDGVLNYEHEGEQPGSGDFGSIVGRCVLAKKIFKLDDCENDRQRMYWDKVGEVPFIYGVFRLFDESDHANAKAAAAIIRDQHAAGEDQILRLSIEGSTIEKEGNVLKRTIARNVALTRKPCNKTSVTGVLHDPKGKQGETPKDEIAALFESATKTEGPLHRKLTSVPFVYVPMDAPEQQLAKALDDLKKMVGGAPGTQVGQDALEKPDLATAEQKNRAKAALRDYDPATHGPFKTYAKAQLPDASGEFIDYFSDLVDDMSLKGKLNFLRKDEPARKPQQRDMFVPDKPRPALDPPGGTPVSVSLRAVGDGADKKKDYPRIVRDIKAAHQAGDPGAPAIPPVEQFNIHRRAVPKGGSYFDENNGVLYLQNQDPLKLYIPDENDHGYGQILRNPGINAIHDRALDNWWALHKVAREGRTPPEVLAWSALFSAMSPNTSVPLQELAYARLVDFANQKGWDPTKELSPKDAEKYRAEFKRLSSGSPEGGGYLPQFLNDAFGPHKVHGGGGDYVGNESGVWSKNGAKTDKSGNIIWRQGKGKYAGDKQKVPDDKKPGYVRPVGLEEDKWQRAADYSAWHGVLHDLYRAHGTDARAISEWLNGMKAVETRPGQDDDASEGGTASGFAPKTIRYLLGMAGMGNVLVPDTHFLRHVFGLMEYDPRNKQVKDALWKARNEHMLQGVDRYYYAHHPAVAWTREKMRRRFGEDPGEQALFPGFWLHWLTVEPHERMRGWVNRAHNGETDHAVFFQQAKRTLDKYGIPYDRRLLKHEEPSDDDQQQEAGDVWADGGSVPARCAHAMKEIESQFGETPAAFAYYSWMVPALLGSHPLAKAELLTIALRKATEGETKKQEKSRYRMFKNKAVDPGEVEFLVGPRKGWRNPLVHFDTNQVGYHVIVGDDGAPPGCLPGTTARTTASCAGRRLSRAAPRCARSSTACRTWLTRRTSRHWSTASTSLPPSLTTLARRLAGPRTRAASPAGSSRSRGSSAMRSPLARWSKSKRSPPSFASSQPLSARQPSICSPGTSSAWASTSRPPRRSCTR
jgi:hypothetical protein